MTIKGIVKTIVAGLIFATTLSCGGSKQVVDPNAMLAYGKEPNEQTMDMLTKSYSAVISKSRKSGANEPGIYADYAVLLVKQGRREEANGWFNKEMETFPSSRSYIMQLKSRMIPEFIDDNSTTSTETESTEPMSTEPVSTEPVSTEPVSTEPVSTEAVPTEAVPTEAVPTEAVPTEAVPTEAVPTETESTETESTETKPTEAGSTETESTEEQ